MSVNNFIPQIWSARILAHLDNIHVYAQPNVINRDYEGDVAQGNTVYINQIGNPTIFDYTKNTDMPAVETLTDARTTMNIDQGKGFNFQIDDVDRAQTRPDLMDPAMARAAYMLSDIEDQFVASKMVAASASANNLGSLAAPLVPTVGTFTDVLNIYNILVDAGTKLNQSNVPRDGRFAIIAPWVEGLLLKDQRFIGAAGTGGPNDVTLNGQIGRAAGFNILVSNNVPTAQGTGSDTNTCYKCSFGHPMAMTYAEQIDKTEAYRPEKRFGDAVKGLHVYGGGVVQPGALGTLTLAQT
jgi:N4-gp56 family major capsid protein